MAYHLEMPTGSFSVFPLYCLAKASHEAGYKVILSGEGSADAAMAVLGMVAGGGLVHQWGIVSTSAGPTPYGKAAVLLGVAFCFGIVRFYRRA